MPKRIPIKTAKAVGDAHPDVRQVVIVAWDGQRTHIVTWGRSLEDCDQAAQGGNMMKDYFGWPEKTHAEPSRVKKLKERIAELEQELKDRFDHA